MSRIDDRTDLNVSAAQAYSAWSDFTSFPTFLDNVDSVTQVDEKTTEWQARVGGQEVAFRAVVTEMDPNRRIAWTSTGGDIDHTGSVTFDSTGDTSSTVEVQIDWEPEGLGERLGSLLGVPKVSISRQLADFKKHVEKQHA